MMQRSIGTVALIVLTAWGAPSNAADPAELRREAAEALQRATQVFRREVAASGGYLWRYSDDLTRREGEGKASATTVWVQPPGTPSVGEAYLTAWRATGDKQYLDAARETAMALVRGQLQSGGWDYRIEYAPADRRRYAYRVDARQHSGESGELRNTSTLDDNTTQSAITFLMHVDQALEHKDSAIHESVEFALQGLLSAQYPNGAWPQRFEGPVAAEKYPVRPASYPDSWPRAFPSQKYYDYYTFNDNSLADCIDVMFEAAALYNEPKYRAAAERAGGFILLAQMPDPQPAWAQQYNLQMQPAWARKFEPPSVTGGESQGVMRILLKLYRETGDKKYLEPIPRAIAYLQGSRLADGRLARFYELRTNKPLYFTRQYELTYSDSDLPTHYGFKVSDSTDSILQEYKRLRQLSHAELAAGQRDETRPRRRSGASRTASAEAVREVIEALDERGRWVESGQLRAQGEDDSTRRIIDCRTFIRNVQVLSNYLAATNSN